MACRCYELVFALLEEFAVLGTSVSTLTYRRAVDCPSAAGVVPHCQRSCSCCDAPAHIFRINTKRCLFCCRSFCRCRIPLSCSLLSGRLVLSETHQVAQFVVAHRNGGDPHSGVHLLLSKMVGSVSPKHCGANSPLCHLGVGNWQLGQPAPRDQNVWEFKPGYLDFNGVPLGTSIIRVLF